VRGKVAKALRRVAKDVALTATYADNNWPNHTKRKRRIYKRIKKLYKAGAHKR
jgi:hypothetical protein